MGSREVEEWLWITSRDLDRATDEVTSSRPRLAGSRYWQPRVDVLEEAHRFLIKAELPGVRSEDIQLAYAPERNAVVLHGVRNEDFSDGDRIGIHQLEILYGEFHREITLPGGAIDSQGIRAQYRNGFLLIMIPKMELLTVTINRI
jgi:HSP20 family protein